MIRNWLDRFGGNLKMLGVLVSVITFGGIGAKLFVLGNKSVDHSADIVELRSRVKELSDSVHNKDKQCQDMEHAVQIATIERRINYCKGVK